MNVTTHKISAGLYAVLVDGRATSIVIAKAGPARYRQVQNWEIGVRVAGQTSWLTGDQSSLEAARDTVRQILHAATATVED